MARSFALGLAVPFIVVFTYNFGGNAAMVGLLMAPVLGLSVLVWAVREYRGRQTAPIAPRRWTLIAALILGLLETAWGGWLTSRIVIATLEYSASQSRR